MTSLEDRYWPACLDMPVRMSWSQVSDDPWLTVRARPSSWHLACAWPALGLEASSSRTVGAMQERRRMSSSRCLCGGGQGCARECRLLHFAAVPNLSVCCQLRRNRLTRVTPIRTGPTAPSLILICCKMVQRKYANK